MWLTSNTTLGTKLANSIMVHRDKDMVHKLARVVNKFDIWTNHGGFVDIPKDKWI